jgi:hypothetical protein
MSDARFNPTHVSLYHALFQLWNINRFENPISVNRSHMLKFSKIGSYTTFYKCMYDLHHWGLIEYIPSHNPFKGSLVNMFSFENHVQNKDAIACTDSLQALDQHLSNSEPSIEQALYPSINNINIVNETMGEDRTRKANESSGNIEKSSKEPKRKKVAPKKEKVFVSPNLNEVLEFFHSEGYPEKEGRKFFYHFESNGWKVSGKSPMKSWTAAAQNWMLNAERFGLQTKTSTSTIPKNKNYDEPL